MRLLLMLMGFLFIGTAYAVPSNAPPDQIEVFFSEFEMTECQIVDDYEMSSPETIPISTQTNVACANLPAWVSFDRGSHNVEQQLCLLHWCPHSCNTLKQNILDRPYYIEPMFFRSCGLVS